MTNGHLAFHLRLPVDPYREQIPPNWTVSEPEQTAGETAVEEFLLFGGGTHISCLHREFLLQVADYPASRLVHCKNTEKRKALQVSNSCAASNSPQYTRFGLYLDTNDYNELRGLGVWIGEYRQTPGDRFPTTHPPTTGTSSDISNIKTVVRAQLRPRSEGNRV